MKSAPITPDNMPAGGFEIRDDAAARAFLSGIKVLEEIEAKGALSLPCIGAVYTHGTHFIIGLWYRGYKTPEENGFLVLGLPRARTTRQKVEQSLKQMLVSQASETLTQPPYVELDRKKLSHD